MLQDSSAIINLKDTSAQMLAQEILKYKILWSFSFQHKLQNSLLETVQMLMFVSWYENKNTEIWENSRLKVYEIESFNSIMWTVGILQCSRSTRFDLHFIKFHFC